MIFRIKITKENRKNEIKVKVPTYPQSSGLLSNDNCNIIHVRDVSVNPSRNLLFISILNITKIFVLK